MVLGTVPLDVAIYAHQEVLTFVQRLSEAPVSHIASEKKAAAKVLFELLLQNPLLTHHLEKMVTPWHAEDILKTAICHYQEHVLTVTAGGTTKNINKPRI